MNWEKNTGSLRLDKTVTLKRKIDKKWEHCGKDWARQRPEWHVKHQNRVRGKPEKRES